MREYGVRRYGDSIYHHCLAGSPSEAASWFAHSRVALARKDFKALVKDVDAPVTDESGIGGNPCVVQVRHGDPIPTDDQARELPNRTSRVLSGSSLSSAHG